MLTQLGMGEALVTGLNEKGIPTPLAATLLCSPSSRMNILTDDEIDGICAKSAIARKYNQDLDSHSAYEILNQKLHEAAQASADVEAAEEAEKPTSRSKNEKSTLEEIMSSPVTKQVARTAANVITRSLLGALGIGGTSGRKKKSSWF
jgi:hypothetical protein